MRLAQDGVAVLRSLPDQLRTVLAESDDEPASTSACSPPGLPGLRPTTSATEYRRLMRDDLVKEKLANLDLVRTWPEGSAPCAAGRSSSPTRKHRLARRPQRHPPRPRRPPRHHRGLRRRRRRRRPPRPRSPPAELPRLAGGATAGRPADLTPPNTGVLEQSVTPSSARPADQLVHERRGARLEGGADPPAPRRQRDRRRDRPVSSRAWWRLSSGLGATSVDDLPSVPDPDDAAEPCMALSLGGHGSPPAGRRMLDPFQAQLAVASKSWLTTSASTPPSSRSR